MSLRGRFFCWLRGRHDYGEPPLGSRLPLRCQDCGDEWKIAPYDGGGS